jgi:hypothetical protein
MKVQLASLTLPIAVHAQGTVRGASLWALST